jgi:hypothetical protein
LRDKHPSLIYNDISDEEKSFETLRHAVNIMKLFSFVTDEKPKQARVFAPGKHSLPSLFQIGPEPTQVEHISGFSVMPLAYVDFLEKQQTL